jgi:hypothetical protein
VQRGHQHPEPAAAQEVGPAFGGDGREGEAAGEGCDRERELSSPATTAPTTKIFGAGGGAQLADDLDVPLLGQLPLAAGPARRLATAARPVTAVEPDGEAARDFHEIARRIAVELKPTKKAFSPSLPHRLRPGPNRIALPGSVASMSDDAQQPFGFHPAPAAAAPARARLTPPPGYVAYGGTAAAMEARFRPVKSSHRLAAVVLQPRVAGGQPGVARPATRPSRRGPSSSSTTR